MELCREFDFGFDLRVALEECLLCQLDAHLVYAGIRGFVLVLNVGVDIAEEQLLFILVGELQTDTLGGWLSLFSESVVDFNDVVKYEWV
jgi:hypothetical protein